MKNIAQGGYQQYASHFHGSYDKLYHYFIIPNISAPDVPHHDELCIRTDLKDRADMPESGSGPVFIAHLASDASNVKGEALSSGIRKPYQLHAVDTGWIAGDHWTYAQVEWQAAYYSNDILYIISVISDAKYAYIGMFSGNHGSDPKTVYYALSDRITLSHQFFTYFSKDSNGRYGWQPTDACLLYLKGVCDSRYARPASMGSIPMSYFWWFRYNPVPPSKTLSNFSFKFGEYAFWLSRANDMPAYIAGNQFGNTGFYHAYYDAFDRLPQNSVNTLANILDVLTSLRGIITRQPVFSPKHGTEAVQDMWLRYRYQYTTTRSDIDEYYSLASRLISLCSTKITSFGSYYSNDVEYRCCIKVDASYFVPDSILSWFKTAGISIKPSTIWDMIPYSFVVDWFLHISSMLEAGEQWISSVSAPISEIWYSFATDYVTGEGARQACYGRWLGNKPSLPLMFDHSASTQTILMRVADSVSLFL